MKWPDFIMIADCTGATPLTISLKSITIINHHRFSSSETLIMSPCGLRQIGNDDQGHFDCKSSPETPPDQRHHSGSMIK